MMIEYKQEFKQHYSELTDFDEYWSTVREFLPQSIRVNTLKISTSKLKNRLKRLKEWKLTQIPWIKQGFWIAGERRDLGNLYEHKLGYIYCQEACSMIPALALKPEQNHIVLDMCAAPGSKTTQIAAMMKNNGLIIANDVNYRRIIALSANLQRCGVINTIIVNHDAGKLTGEYDKILLDAPCTGYGTIRGQTGNSINNLKEWNLNSVKNMSGIQKRLIIHGFDLLKKDAEMIYSTCSLEPLEDEHVVEYLLKKRPNAKLISTNLEIKSRINVDGFEKCLKIWPQFYNTEGFFIAKIKKKE